MLCVVSGPVAPCTLWIFSRATRPSLSAVSWQDLKSGLFAAGKRGFGTLKIKCRFDFDRIAFAAA